MLCEHVASAAVASRQSEAVGDRARAVEALSEGLASAACDPTTELASKLATSIIQCFRTNQDEAAEMGQWRTAMKQGVSAHHREAGAWHQQLDAKLAAQQLEFKAWRQELKEDMAAQREELNRALRHISKELASHHRLGEEVADWRAKSLFI